MKSRILLGLVLLVFGLSAQARTVRLWSDAELEKASDLVVIGQPIEVKDLDETNSLGLDQSESFRPKFRGVETTFKVSDVLKGTPASDHIVLHHFRVEIGWGSPPNGPDLISFGSNNTNEYLLYLKDDGINRYAPTAGQIDAGLSIKPAPDPFQTWLSSNQRLDLTVPGKVYGVTLSQQGWKVIVVQVQVGSAKDSEHKSESSFGVPLQVWLLRTDGTSVLPRGKPDFIGISNGGYVDYSMVYTFAKVRTQDVTGVVVSVDGEPYYRQMPK